jgi:hypothetical protein
MDTILALKRAYSVYSSTPLSNTWYGFLPSGGGPATSWPWTPPGSSGMYRQQARDVVVLKPTLLNNKFSS